ncbi:LysR substrate-binding domain-containing protein [Salinicola rhizosphaerae]|uniref:Transcriptional regulator n=1 Tax=Salinicola rhizosphaerae TaxID=1443141 RepID=A0ABQ3DXS1_9GAMM|nr:LysR substrate-binding domain-containing protein [Salinicola rhizosphaerae]GHB17244.1 transcriptional regulator [Salinicola rhizosphaerae]
MPTRFPSLPPLATLRPFEAAARHLSFKRAAAELSLSEAAISRQIRQLETHVGSELFVRGHRQVQLTANGEALARSVARGLSEIDGGISAIQSHRPSGHVVLRIELYLAMYWLVPRLTAFHRANPDLRVQLAATTEPLSKAESAFDLAIQASDRPDGGHVVCLTAAERIFPFCSPAVAAAGSLTLKDLARLPRLSFTELEGDAWLNWEGWMQRIGFRGRLGPPAEVYDSYPVEIEAALAGQGIGLGWARGLGDLFARGALVNPVRESVLQPQGLAVYRGPDRGDDDSTDRVLAWLETELDAPLLVTD